MVREWKRNIQLRDMVHQLLYLVSLLFTNNFRLWLYQVMGAIRVLILQRTCLTTRSRLGEQLRRLYPVMRMH